MRPNLLCLGGLRKSGDAGILYSRSGQNVEEQSNRTKIEALAAKLAERAGLELVECDLFHAGRRLILRVFADKEGGISLDDCQKL
ncbi:MAG: hypothetical protein J6V65_04395, partial [Fibrobacterales bacterium]|nr:hypothetical protein [Fibrobacterales bacterium]